MSSESPIPSNYAPLVTDLKQGVRAAQVKAAVSVNSELIQLYWHIGRKILQAQSYEGWGTKVVDRLARDLATTFPEMKGFSPLNLKRMRAFCAAWSAGEAEESEIVSRAVTQLERPPEPLTQLSWGANLEKGGSLWKTRLYASTEAPCLRLRATMVHDPYNKRVLPRFQWNQSL